MSAPAPTPNTPDAYGTRAGTPPVQTAQPVDPPQTSERVMETVARDGREDVLACKERALRYCDEAIARLEADMATQKARLITERDAVVVACDEEIEHIDRWKADATKMMDGFIDVAKSASLKAVTLIPPPPKMVAPQPRRPLLTALNDFERDIEPRPQEPIHDVRYTPGRPRVVTSIVACALVALVAVAAVGIKVARSQSVPLDVAGTVLRCSAYGFGPEGGLFPIRLDREGRVLASVPR